MKFSYPEEKSDKWIQKLIFTRVPLVLGKKRINHWNKALCPSMRSTRGSVTGAFHIELTTKEHFRTAVLTGSFPPFQL